MNIDNIKYERKVKYTKQKVYFLICQKYIKKD